MLKASLTALPYYACMLAAKVCSVCLLRCGHLVHHHLFTTHLFTTHLFSLIMSLLLDYLLFKLLVVSSCLCACRCGAAWRLALPPEHAYDAP